MEIRDINKYQKIIKSRKVRQKILSLLRFIPDKIMVKIQYRIKFGRKLNYDNPLRFTEKIQKYKLEYRDDLITKCVDKFEVRDFVKKRNLEDILVKLYGVYSSFEEINFSKLPNKFVIKTTNGSGGLNVSIVNDKDSFNFDEIKNNMKLEKIQTRTGGREWPYYEIEPKYIIEQLLINSDNPEAGIDDYKIFCYNGKAKFVVVDVDRFIGHKRNIYTVDWIDLETSTDCPKIDREIKKPLNYEHMIEVAEKLSNGFPFVRVDLYNNKGKIYFGEMTFYPWSGYVQFNPDDIDFLLGQDFII